MITQTIIGPPGTGKTREIENIIKNGDLKDYLYLTYNINMAASARERIEDDRHKIGTIHSIMAQQNGIGPFLNYKDKIEFAKETGLTYNVETAGYGESDLERFLRFYDMTVNLMEKPLQPVDEKIDMPFLYDKYDEWKIKLKKYDYTDILRIGAEGHYYTRTLFVDEAQDLSPLMWQIVDHIEYDNGVIVGDPHQSINGFRGVRVKDFEKRIRDYRVLGKSYRFGDNVRLLADRVLGSARIIQTNYQGIGNTEIGKHSIREFSSLPGTKAILCRTNALAMKIARMLPYAMIPINPEHSYGNGWSDVTFKIASIMKRFPDISAEEFRYIVDRSPADLWVRGTKAKVKKEATLFSYDLMKKRMTPSDIVMRMDIDQKTKDNVIALLLHDMPVIQVDTIHASKGLEWDNIMVALDMPKHIIIGNDEKRLFYVALTRARKNLDFTYFGIYTETFDIPGQAKIINMENF